MIKSKRDICTICGRDVEKSTDGDRFCNKCGWVDEYDEYEINDTKWSES
jgi:anaerobic ribonucleoside-triphosphate reductase